MEQGSMNCVRMWVWVCIFGVNMWLKKVKERLKLIALVYYLINLAL